MKELVDIDFDDNDYRVDDLPLHSATSRQYDGTRHHVPSFY